MKELEIKQESEMEQETEVQKSNWLEQEIENTKTQSFDGERLPALKLEESKIASIEIDFSKPFDKWEQVEDGKTTIKKIIPVTFKGEKLVWWLNVRNPIYNQILQKGMQGQTQFKILQTGTQKNTKYTLIEE